MSQSDKLIENSRELQHALGLARRICVASEHLFGDSPTGTQIVGFASRYEQRCHAILSGRTGDLVTIAIVGSKGQGKTWLARQMLLEQAVQKRLPSGVLTSESTHQLYWIGPRPPDEFDPRLEVYVPCDSGLMFDVGFPYMCLDTPGTTDANRLAASSANDSMAVAPIQILVVRRDQLRSAAASQIVSQSEGIFCIPVVTAVPLDEMNREGIAVQSLQSDTVHWLATLRSTAPNTLFQEAIFLPDFEALGSEEVVASSFRSELLTRLRNRNQTGLGESVTTRLASAASRLKYDVNHAIETDAPQLATAVIQMQEAANSLPKKAIASVLGSELVLETAIRARLRTQIVTDTSPLWFPYRPTLTLLAFTQGAWDQLILAMTGSIPSLFGTFAAWAKNIHQSRKIQWDMQEGLRERLNLQAVDQLQPIQRQFHNALSQLRGNDGLSDIAKVNVPSTSDSRTNPTVRLAGIDELQSRSLALFQQRTDAFRTPRWMLSLTAFFGVALFWLLLSGPIVSVYHQYLSASYHTFSQIRNATISSTDELANDAKISSVPPHELHLSRPRGDLLVDEFPHPSPSLLMTSIVLSFLPMLIYAMVALTLLLKKSKTGRIAFDIQKDQHALVERLQDEGIVRLEFQDTSLQHAHFLLGLDRPAKDNLSK